MNLKAFGVITLFSVFFTSIQIKAQKLAILPYSYSTLGEAPVDIQNCGDDRLFVIDRAGLVEIINPDGTFRPTPFLDISAKIFHGSDEEALIGMAFSPDYKTNGKFYVYYVGSVAGNATSIVEQYKVSAADSNIADGSSALTILTQSQPYDIHKGGNLMFGKDGFLFINFGDGGSPQDAIGYAQRRNTLLGKIVRIDVKNSTVAQPYAIPSSNPFYNDITGTRKEIWAIGLRNPWRASIDRITGDRWFTDVGENNVEEIDFEAANSAGGKNYGWNITEGNLCFRPASGCVTSGLTAPFYSYPTSVGNAIMGGYVCRSAQSKSLFGTYIFADFISKWIDGIKQSNGVITETVHLVTSAQDTIGYPLSFGEDRNGDLYILFLSHRTIYKLTDTSSVRRPKAYFTPLDNGNGSFLLDGLDGKNLRYQWLRDNNPISGATTADYATSTTGRYTLVVTNSLNFSDTSDAFILGALPLDLVSFNAQKLITGKVRLQWKIASEQGVSGYTILRRQSNDPNFSTIGFVQSKAANGTSTSEIEYNFVDSFALSNSKLFYRLQILHKDGSLTYSDIRIISLNSKANSFTIFPNPAMGQVQIQLDNFTKPVTMMLYDNAGKKIKQQLLSQQVTTLELPGLRGLYFIQMSSKDGSNVIRKKLLIQ